MNKSALEAVALSMRSLAMDGIQKANSGHPGLPLGAAELGAVLYGNVMKYNPANPSWMNRDRFILSAGHGSMFLYSILHIAGFDVSLDDVKNFRQLGSKCPGHPEHGLTAGVEMTTGPLGQGISSAVGFAIAETMLAARFNTTDCKIVDHYTYALCGEGCLMEGVSSEASSLAGHLKLGKLIAFYDENHITIDGTTDVAFTEDVAHRYEAYGWQVLRGSMYNMEDIETLIAKAKADKLHPTLIMLRSVIGKGAPTVEGTPKAHGAPLGADGIAAAKKNLGLDPEKTFYVAPEAYQFFDGRKKELAADNAAWDALFAEWSKKYPEKRAEWNFCINGTAAVEAAMPSYKEGDSVSTRNAGGAALNAVAAAYPCLIGGAADLKGSNVTNVKAAVQYTANTREGRQINFGIREFGMAAICNGLALHGGFKPFCSTFMVFSDYLRPALRLSALMQLPVIYILTHDSFYVGEDGPTHQPVETVTALRTIPGVRVFRPGDAEETNLAYELAMEEKSHPVCLALTRQNLPVYKKEDPDWKNTARCGAYIVTKGSDSPDITILATGSEVSMALKAAGMCTAKKIRIVSVLSRELFESQPESLRATIIGGSARVMTAEAGIGMGWDKFATSNDDIMSIDRFGECGEANSVAKYLKFTAEDLAAKINAK